MSEPADVPFSVDGQLCFALHEASRAIVACYRAPLAAIGITYSQYLVMMALWERQPRSIGELGQQLALDSGTLSPLLKRLEAMGLVTRTRREDDERVVEVRLTPQGRTLRTKARKVQRQVQERTGMSVPQIVALREELHGLSDRLRGAGTEPDAALG